MLKCLVLLAVLTSTAAVKAESLREKEKDAVKAASQLRKDAWEEEMKSGGSSPLNQKAKDLLFKELGSERGDLAWSAMVLPAMRKGEAELKATLKELESITNTIRDRLPKDPKNKKVLYALLIQSAESTAFQKTYFEDYDGAKALAKEAADLLEKGENEGNAANFKARRKTMNWLKDNPKECGELMREVRKWMKP